MMRFMSVGHVELGPQASFHATIFFRRLPCFLHLLRLSRSIPAIPASNTDSSRPAPIPQRLPVGVCVCNQAGEEYIYYKLPAPSCERHSHLLNYCLSSFQPYSGIFLSPPAPPPSPIPPYPAGTLCENTCATAFNGFCEDGSSKSFESATCAYGTDCT